jgi:dipeptidyl-peptidase-3
VVNDFDALRRLFGELLKEVQRIKSTGDYEAGRKLVEDYAVKIDYDLHKEVLERYAKLNLEPYSGFVNPDYELVEKDGEIVDVKIVYKSDFTEQMLHYSTEWSFLPSIN